METHEDVPNQRRKKQKLAQEGTSSKGHCPLRLRRPGSGTRTCCPWSLAQAISGLCCARCLCGRGRAESGWLIFTPAAATSLPFYSRGTSTTLKTTSFFKLIQMKGKEIVIRLRTEAGLKRITLLSSDTVKTLREQVSLHINLSPKDFQLWIENKSNLTSPDHVKLAQIPAIQDGVNIGVKELVKRSTFVGKQIPMSKQTTTLNQTNSKCNHGPTGKCMNCIPTQPKEDKDKQKDSQKAKCSHGPSGKCFNCMSDATKSDNKQIEQKWMCNHGPHAKCSHCMDKEFISDVAHISFDNYLDQKKLKCKGVHTADVKCNNCLPPSQIKYKVNLMCTNHAPYPQGMCSKCLPPTVTITRQPYRHIDFVQFMNVTELSNFVKDWTKNKMEKQRFGWLYGYYASDPNYKGGVRAIVQTIYQPPQSSNYSSFQLLMDPRANQVDIIASALGFEKIGWIITETNNDTVLSQKQLRFAAKMQDEFAVRHSSGYPVSKFITVIIRENQKTKQIQPEVFMISDLGQALQKQGLFVDSGSRKMMKIRPSSGKMDLVPSFNAGNKQVTQFQTEYLIVKLSQGSSGNKYAIIKNSDFPVENRSTAQTKSELKEYLRKYKGKPTQVKYSDFHLLLYLSKLVDIQTVLGLSESVTSQENKDGLDMLVNQYANN